MGVAVEPAGHAIDGMEPRRTVAAASDADVVDVVRAANEQQEGVVVIGGATRLGVGDAPARYDVALDLRGYRGIVDYEPDDLVATIRAGTTLAELSAALAPRAQRWPVEAGHHERATVGGIFASAAAGPSRLRYFHPRDWVIGARVVLGDGTLVRSGGRVVKNVTGYDLTRLWSGTFGTLAVILELTLKLTAAPERTMTLLGETDVETALVTAAALNAAGLPLDALAVVTGDAVGAVGARGDAALVVRLAGPTEAVRRLGRAVRERLRSRDVANETWDVIASLPLDTKWTARIGWPAALRPDVGFEGYSAVIYPANGLAFLLRSIDRNAFRRVRSALEAAGGFAVLERASVAYKRDVGGPWGTGRTPPSIARELKRRFDPRGVLAPGRMPA
ncbi:MAG TPA: FAD-binding protein [Candidatus Limnocylindria bacterium]